MAHFPFFRLPPELRDRIYKELGGECHCFNLILPSEIEESTAQDDQPAMAVAVISAPGTNFLLVSRDFKHEYGMESRRHMFVWAIASLPAENFRTLVLKNGGRVHRCFREIPTLVIRMWYHDDYDSQKSCSAVRDMLLPYMENLKSITDDLLYKIPDDSSEPRSPEAVLNQSAFDVRSITLPGRRREISLHTRYFFECRRLSLIKSFGLTKEDSESYPQIWSRLGSERLRRWIECHPTNSAEYQVMPVADVNGQTTGFDYTIISADSVDLEEMMADIEDLLRRDATGS